MKRMAVLLIYAYAAFSLLSCTQGDKGGGVEINGQWVLRSILYPEGYKQHLDTDSWLRIYDDTCFYQCEVAAAPTGIMFVPMQMEHYSLVRKGKHEYFYMQNGETHPFHVVDDTTIVIQERGCKFTWCQTDAYEEKYVKNIVNVIKEEAKGGGKTTHRYVFSYAEHELESENLLLTCILTAIIIAALNYAFYSYNKRKRMRQELQLIEQEQRSLPEPVRKAKNTVEEDFHHSDFYISLHRKIANGERLNKEDWNEIENQLKNVYPRFVSTLFNLHSMSQVEYRVCLLLKLNVGLTEMSNVLCKDKSSISNTRRRLYEKVFDKKGTGKDWDEFIHSL